MSIIWVINNARTLIGSHAYFIGSGLNFQHGKKMTRRGEKEAVLAATIVVNSLLRFNQIFFSSFF